MLGASNGLPQKESGPFERPGRGELAPTELAESAALFIGRQTIVHLGVDLADVMTKATLADAFAIALKRIGLAVTRPTTQP